MLHYLIENCCTQVLMTLCLGLTSSVRDGGGKYVCITMGTNRVHLTYLSFVKSFIKEKLFGFMYNSILRTTTKKELNIIIFYIVIKTLLMYQSKCKTITSHNHHMRH